jgi:FAD/FMN-containing dehydrogenase
VLRQVCCKQRSLPPDGKTLIANASTNPDLFWALKGGGVGTFGVVTKVTLATYELPKFFGRVGGLITAISDAAFRNLIGEFMGFYHEALFNPHWGGGLFPVR